MGPYFVFLLLWTTFLMNLSLELEMTEQEMKVMKGKFCGSHLSDMLSLVCNGVYNNKPKRNMYRNQIDLESTVEYPDEEAILSFPFRSKRLARSIIPVEFRKRTQGVATECCHKSCSLWEMSSYCGSQ